MTYKNVQDIFCKKITVLIVVFYLAIYQFPMGLGAELALTSFGGMFFLLSSRKEIRLNKILIVDFFIFYFLSVFLYFALENQKNNFLLVTISSVFSSVFIYIVLSRVVKNLNFIKIIFCGVFLGSLLSSILVLFFRLKTGISNPEILVKILPSSVFIVPNDFLIISISAPFMIAALLIEKSVARNFMLMIGLAFYSIAIFISYSRSVAFIFFFVSYVAVGLIKKNFFAKILIACLFVIFLFVIFFNSDLIEKIKAYNFLCETRIPLWSAAWNLWLENIFFGHGANSYASLYQAKITSTSFLACSLVDQRLTPWPHNLYLELLSSYGLLGTIPFVFLIGWSFLVNYKITKTKNDSLRIMAIGNFSALIGFFIASLLELTLLRYWVFIFFFTIVGISVALKLIDENLRSCDE